MDTKIVVKVAQDSFDCFDESVRVLVCEQDFNNKITGYALPLTMKQAVSGEALTETFRLSNEAAQRLMDSLWHCGIRPVGAKGSTGQLAATERHLEDMRRLVFVKQANKSDDEA
jgi:hypothetical protein